MLPGHPNSSGTTNGGMPPTGQNVPTLESAQNQPLSHSPNNVQDPILLESPRSRSHMANFEIVQKMNSLLGNALNLTNFVQEKESIFERQGLSGFGDGEQQSTPTNRAFGSMRPIRGSGGNPIRSAEPNDVTPNKQPPQFSDQLKAILARQTYGGDFGSLISPLPMAAVSSGGAVASSASYPWPPLSIYQSPDVSAYLGGVNRFDYCALRDPMTWAPLPIAPPSSSSLKQTPPAQADRNISPERSASTGSSSSGMSMNHLTDLMAQLQLNSTDSSPWPVSYQQTPQPAGSDANNQEWRTIYQLRHASQPPVPMPPLVSPSPPPIATSAPNLSPNQNEYAALVMAAANYSYINNGSGISSGSNPTSNKGPISQCDPQYGSLPVENADADSPDQQFSIERAARIYRKAATICDATCTWSGQLPVTLITRAIQNQSYAVKVFVGGVPWDITEALLAAFSPFGPVRVEWPGKEARYAKSAVKPSAKGKGYVYMIYESDRSVKALLENCVRDFAHNGEYYFQLTSRRLRTKEIRQVQIIPWNISDSNFLRSASQRLDPKKTVFVGALHGMITAEVLSNVLNDLFGGVVYAGIDTDKYKYPIGSGRVTFNNTRSYQKAIAAAFIEIKSAKFAKKVQIDPYLEDAMCSNCLSAPGPYFCREFMCFRYFCKTCWHNQHALDVMQSHKPLMRNTRRSQPSQGVASGFPNFPTSNGQQF